MRAGSETGDWDFMNQTTIRKQLEALIKKVNHSKGKTISEDVILFGEQGVLDSVATIKLIMSVEEAFDITVEEKEINPKNFQTIAALTRFVESKLMVALTATLALILRLADLGFC
jgi:acyl carrier protein